jgi:hypothetical protein
MPRNVSVEDFERGIGSAGSGSEKLPLVCAEFITEMRIVAKKPNEDSAQETLLN